MNERERLLTFEGCGHCASRERLKGKIRYYTGSCRVCSLWRDEIEKKGAFPNHEEFMEKALKELGAEVVEKSCPWRFL